MACGIVAALQGVIYSGLCILRRYAGACALRSAMPCCTLAMGICAWSGGMRQEYGRAWRLMLCGAACGDVLVICCQAGGEMMRLDAKEY